MDEQPARSRHTSPSVTLLNLYLFRVVSQLFVRFGQTQTSTHAGRLFLQARRGCHRALARVVDVRPPCRRYSTASSTDAQPILFDVSLDLDGRWLSILFFESLYQRRFSSIDWSMTAVDENLKEKIRSCFRK